MTTEKLIGKDTARARLIVWHCERITRAFPFMNPEEQAEKLHQVTGGLYGSATTRKICKEYDDVFSVAKQKWTADDQATLDSLSGTLVGRNDLKMCSALMG